MRTFLAFLALILALGAAAVAAYGYYERTCEAKRLSETIESLESRIAAAERMAQSMKNLQESEDAAVPPAVDKEMASLREKVEGVNTRVEILGTQVSALRESDKTKNLKLAKIEENLASAPAASPVGSSVRKEDIEELIEEKMKGQQRLGKEPPLSAVAARLELEEVERGALEDILRQKKNEFMTLLKSPRADGTNMLEEFADEIIGVMVSGDEQKAKQTFMKFFQRLAAEQVPGTEKTYLAEIVRMQAETRDSFKTALSEKQYQAFEALGIENAMDIKIPNEPIEIYLQQRMQASGAAPGGQ